MNENAVEFLSEIAKTLNKLSSQLDTITYELRNLRTIIRSSQSTSIEQTKALMLSKSKLRSQIYELCDGKHTVSQISKTLTRPSPLVSRYLKELEEAGLISSERHKGAKYYYRIL